MDYYNSMEYICLRTIDQLITWRYFETNRIKASKIQRAMDNLDKRKGSYQKPSMTPYYIYAGIVFIFAMVVLVSVR